MAAEVNPIMDLDDFPVGRVLTRREAVAVLAGAGALLFFGCSSATDNSNTDTPTTGCVVRPELTEGPYYVDEELNRSDIRSDPSDGSMQEGPYSRSPSMSRG
jgi:hypothetical protein